MCLLLLEAADRDALRFLSVLLLEDLLTLLVVGESVPKPSVVGELVLADLTLFEDLADLLLTSPSVGESVAKLSVVGELLIVGELVVESDVSSADPDTPVSVKSDVNDVSNDLFGALGEELLLVLPWSFPPPRLLVSLEVAY